MKKTTLGIIVGAMLICCMAALRVQNNGISIVGAFGGEPKLTASQPDQTADWILFTSNGVAVFRIPANGILPAANGGSGTNAAGASFTNIVLTDSNGVTHTNNLINGEFY